MLYKYIIVAIITAGVTIGAMTVININKTTNISIEQAETKIKQAENEEPDLSSMSLGELIDRGYLEDSKIIIGNEEYF